MTPRSKLLNGNTRLAVPLAILCCAAGALISSNHYALAADVPWLAEVQQKPTTPSTLVLPPLIDPAQPLPVAEWQTRREALRQTWLKWLGPMPERPANRTWKVLRTDTLPEVTRELIEYEGEPGRLVQAYLLRPRGEAAPHSRPGVVALHPTTDRTIEPIAGVEGEPMRHTALTLAKAGFVVICPRCFLWQDVKSLQQAVAEHQARHPHTRGMHKMLYDAQRAVDLLVSQPDVDPRFLSTYGHSLGAKEALYLAAFDDRIQAAVASEGGIGYPSTNWEAPWYLGPEVLDPACPRQHHELLALIAPRPFLVLGGESGRGAADGERSWPYLEAAFPVYRLYGEPVRLGLLNHREGHLLSPASMAKLTEWLTVYATPSKK